MLGPVTLFAVPDIPDIRPGDDLDQILGDCLKNANLTPEGGDILCIAHKVFSKAEGNVIALKDVEPSQEALRIAAELNKDSRKVDVILRESTRVLRSFKRPDQNEGVMICEHKLGFISANAAMRRNKKPTIQSYVLKKNKFASMYTTSVGFLLVYLIYCLIKPNHGR